MLIGAFGPRFDVLPSQRYGPKGAVRDTPDVLVKDRGQIVAVMECKATKLTYAAQFAERPIEEAQNGYDQIVKGITQLWRFFSHARLGIFQVESVAADAVGVVLTMDSWMQISRELQDEATARARKLMEGDLGISDADMRPVVFCSAQDLSDVLFVSDEDQFLTTLAQAASPEYAGWGLREVRRATGGEEERRDFPLEVPALLPWWERFQRAEPAGGS